MKMASMLPKEKKQELKQIGKNVDADRTMKGNRTKIRQIRAVRDAH